MHVPRKRSVIKHRQRGSAITRLQSKEQRACFPYVPFNATLKAVGALGSLAIAHTMALATLIDKLVRDNVIDVGEITKAYSKLATDLRKE